MFGFGVGQVPDQRSQSSFCWRHNRFFATIQAGGVDPGQQPHGGGLHIPLNPGQLPGQQQVRSLFALQGG